MQKIIYENMRYTVGEEKISGNTAAVAVEITVTDIKTVFSQYLAEAFTHAADENWDPDGQAMLEMMAAPDAPTVTKKRHRQYGQNRRRMGDRRKRQRRFSGCDIRRAFELSQRPWRPAWRINDFFWRMRKNASAQKFFRDIPAAAPKTNPLAVGNQRNAPAKDNMPAGAPRVFPRRFRGCALRVRASTPRKVRRAVHGRTGKKTPRASHQNARKTRPTPHRQTEDSPRRKGQSRSRSSSGDQSFSSAAPRKCPVL